MPAHVAMGSGGLLSTLRGKSSRQAGLEQNLLLAYRKICTSVGNSPEPTQLLHQYLHTCHTLPYYGCVICTSYSFKKNLVFLTSFSNHALKFRCAFFLGEIDKPSQGILQRAKRKSVNVGICLEGVYVMDVKEKVTCFSL